MQTKWKEMTKAQKTHQIISLILSLIAFVFVMVDITTEWKYAHLCWGISFGVYMLYECIGMWNKKRSTAIIELAIAVVLIAFSIVATFM